MAISCRKNGPFGSRKPGGASLDTSQGIDDSLRIAIMTCFPAAEAVSLCPGIEFEERLLRNERALLPFILRLVGGQEPRFNSRVSEANRNTEWPWPARDGGAQACAIARIVGVPDKNDSVHRWLSEHHHHECLSCSQFIRLRMTMEVSEQGELVRQVAEFAPPCVNEPPGQVAACVVGRNGQPKAVDDCLMNPVNLEEQPIDQRANRTMVIRSLDDEADIAGGPPGDGHGLT